MSGIRLKQAFFLLLLTACAWPKIGTTTALVGGILFSLLIGNPWPGRSSVLGKVMLQVSVVGLGFGLSLGKVWQVGKGSIIYTAVGICLTLMLGAALSRLFKVSGKTGMLISFGTAICGGSAIAAMAPAIGAESDEVAVSFATVFTLNSLALLLFPLIGHLLQMSQHSFGVWAGLAIHDTSSVVGAAAAYGAEALAVGTTVKLSRVIWITPCVMTAARLCNSQQKARIPIFMVGFLAAATLHSLLPQAEPAWGIIAAIARQGLVTTLFIIGAGLSREALQKVGLRPMLLGTALWFLVSIATLAAICEGLIVCRI